MWWHVADDWCYLGCAGTLDEAQALAAAPAHFDLDTYQILAPRMAQWMPEAVPLAVTKTFVLTAPEVHEAAVEAPRAVRTTPGLPARKAPSPAGQQTLGLFAD
ncbi:nucleotide excision repair endonuclease [compost metagenome]